jgi:hypothetical protein
MFFDGKRLVFMKPFADSQTPTQGERQYAQELTDAFRLCQVGVFELETAAFQASKEGFNFPSAGIIIQRRLWGLIGDENEIVIFDAHANDEDGHAPYASRLRQQAGLPDTGVLKKPESGQVTGATGIGHEGVTFDPDAKPNPLPFEKFHPVRADKLPVSRETLDPVSAELTEKMLEQGDPFEGVGIAAFVQEYPQERDSNAIIGDGKHENIDIQVAEFPVRAVKA